MTDWRHATPTGYDGYATKPSLWRPLSRAIGGFDLDPAAGTEDSPIADNRYTPDDDGLSQPWFGTVWLNPPFSDKKQWYKRLVGQHWNHDVDKAVAVAPVGTSAAWFHDWFSTADMICFLEGRDWFTRNPGSAGSPSFSVMVGCWNAPECRETLDGMGTVMNL